MLGWDGEREQTFNTTKRNGLLHFFDTLISVTLESNTLFEREKKQNPIGKKVVQHHRMNSILPRRAIGIPLGRLR